MDIEGIVQRIDAGDIVLLTNLARGRRRTPPNPASPMHPLHAAARRRLVLRPPLRLLCQWLRLRRLSGSRRIPKDVCAHNETVWVFRCVSLSTCLFLRLLSPGVPFAGLLGRR